jgi:type IV secretory pathway protease TraF
VAFHAERIGYGNIWIREGYLLDRILAEPHDEVEFTASAVRIKGVASPRLPLMLSQGSLVMPEKTWLVWPSLRTVTRYNANEYDVGKSVLQMAQVRREQIVGKPFRRWFWRDQTQ